jgi:hypothetical protein
MERRTKHTGTPKYERLKAWQGWPDLDKPDTFLWRCSEELTTDGDPAAGSVESKAAVILGKLTKWSRRQASAAHHLAAILGQLQRPGGSWTKRELAELIRERVEDYRRLEDILLDAIAEACGVEED